MRVFIRHWRDFLTSDEVLFGGVILDNKKEEITDSPTDKEKWSCE